MDKPQSFNDGVVNIYEVTDTSTNGDKPKATKAAKPKNTLRFHERTVGVTRFYSAMQANKKVSRVLRCQKITSVSTLDVATIGSIDYEILQIQYPEDVDPPVMDLTLSLIKAV